VESTGRGDYFGACAVCGLEFEGQSVTDAILRHDDDQDHAFVLWQSGVRLTDEQQDALDAETPYYDED
jgi:hypothetical protein